MIEGKIVRVSMLNYFYQLIRDIFVLQETGKGLSTNDYTTDEKTAVAKITDIETDLENKVDGEVYDESGYVTGVSFKKGSYSISLGTNAGDPRISIKNETTTNFDLAQKNELTQWAVYDTGLTLFGPEYSSAIPTLSLTKTNNGVTVSAEHDTGIIKGVPSTELTSKEYVDGYVQETIAAELADISGVDFVVVAANEELPATGVKGKFYLKATGAAGGNKYDEYVWVNHGTAEEPDYGYEKIGTMDVDLTGYIKESDIQFATKADIDAIFGTTSGE